MEPFLCIVGSQHYYQQAHRLVACEAGKQVTERGKPFVKRIGKDGCPPRQPFLKHQVVLPKLFSEQAGPSFLFIKAKQWSIRTVVRAGAIAMGIGVPQADNMFFHRNPSRKRFYLAYHSAQRNANKTALDAG